jgi:hypothetical protein
VKRTKLLIAALLVAWSVRAGPASSQQATPNPAGESPELPPGVTLSSIVSRQTHRFDFIGKKAKRVVSDAPVAASISTVMAVIATSDTSALDKYVTDDPRCKKIRDCQTFLRACRSKEDVVEAVLKANAKERVYKNSEIIDAAAPLCCAQTNQRFRQRYPDR